MRKPFIAGNWKMNNTVAESVAFIGEIKDGLSAIEGVDTAVCPPAIAIPAVAEALSGTGIGVGAQNMAYAESGAYTGELAPSMLAPYCQYVILGHSERRGYFGETGEGVNTKANLALAHGMTPIICVGESLEQNEAGMTNSFVSEQVTAALVGLSAEQVAGLVIAYEPIWAIGTGKSATAEQANEIIATAVRATIASLYDDTTAQATRIQYGGSVKPHNIAGFMAQSDIDGALVGGASLKPSFIELVQNAL